MLRAAVLMALLASGAHASVSVTIQNSCSESIALYDNSATTTMAAGATTTRTLANGYVGMFRNGASDSATLAEFSVDSDGTPWYDLSIIPPGSGSCTSLEACQELTGTTGFNTALQIAPQSNTDSDNCETVTCLEDGCDEAYQYPSDDDNTHTCPSGTSFLVTFCPGGSGGSSSSSTSSEASSSETTSTPTSTPEPTTATPEPTTATPEPTTATPEPTTATPEPTTATPEPTTETPTVTPTATPTATTAAPTTTPEPTTATPTVTPTPSTETPTSSESSADETGNEAEEGNFTISDFTPSPTATETSAPTTTAPSTTAPVSTTSAPTSTSGTTTLSAGTSTTTSSESGSSGSDDTETINTQSSDSSSSTVGIVFAAGAAVLGIAAGGFIYTMRQKRKKLEMEAKTPRDLLNMATPAHVL